LQQLLSYQAIPAGTVLMQSMRLRRVSELELALFVQAISRWALDPTIGGKRNHGLGGISAQWQVRARMPGELAFTPWGSIGFGSDGEGVEAEGQIADYLDVKRLAQPIGADDLDFSSRSLAALA